MNRNPKTFVEECERRDGRAVCPECKRIKPVLFLPPGGRVWACWRCHGLAWVSQRFAPSRMAGRLDVPLFQNPAALEAARIEAATLLPLPDPLSVPLEIAALGNYAMGRYRKRARQHRARHR